MKFFWPIFLSSLVVGTVGMYMAAPFARPYVSGLFGSEKAEPMAAETGTHEQIRTFTETHVPAPQPAATAAQTTAAADDDTPPALVGVYPVGRGDRPGWGVTHQRATYYKPDGSRLGSVAGGVLFDFKESRQTSKGVMIEGLFFQNGATNGPYLVSRKDVHLFTASHEKMSARQLDALRAYYALSGKIGMRKTELLQASAAKNPHFTAYNEAYRVFTAHIAKGKELLAQRDKATELDRARLDDRLREMKVAETKIKADYEALHLKFREWKTQHAVELAKPENDPDVMRWTQEMAALRKIIPGLAL